MMHADDADTLRTDTAVNTIRFDEMYLTCNQNLMGSQLLQGIKQKV